MGFKAPKKNTADLRKVIGMPSDKVADVTVAEDGMRIGLDQWYIKRFSGTGVPFTLRIDGCVVSARRDGSVRYSFAVDVYPGKEGAE